MSAAATLSGASLTSAQQQFTATLSAVEDAVHYAFHKRLRPQEYREALAEARAAAWHAWHGLLRRGKDPLEVEQKLVKFTPPEFLQNAHHWLILHGRYVCIARKPGCPECLIRDLCEYRKKTRV